MRPDAPQERAAWVSLVATVLVVAVKLVAAWASGSVGVLAEGLQSLVDVAVTFGVLQTVRLASLPPDKEHPYGHGKAEVLMSAAQMIVVLVTAGFIIVQAYLRLVNPVEIVPHWGMVGMAYAILSNGLVVTYLRRTARRTGSVALQSESLHLMTDIAACVGVFGGLGLVALTGIRAFDPIVAILLMIWVIIASYRYLVQQIHPLMDGSLPPEELAILEQELRAHPQVRGYHNVRTRQAGRLRVIELHVTLDDHLTFAAAHDAAEHIEKALSHALHGALVSIHYEPHEAETRHRAEVHGD
jgi:cation diffusion facilitator family transporter